MSETATEMSKRLYFEHRARCEIAVEEIANVLSPLVTGPADMKIGLIKRIIDDLPK